MFFWEVFLFVYYFVLKNVYLVFVFLIQKVKKAMPKCIKNQGKRAHFEGHPPQVTLLVSLD